jgi:hypothetical protein
MVFMDSSSTVQSAGSQATGVIGMAIVLSIFVMALKLAVPLRKRITRPERRSASPVSID